MKSPEEVLEILELAIAEADRSSKEYETHKLYDTDYYSYMF